MLDVDRADDVDAGAQQVLHVFVTLSVLAIGRVGVREFIDQRDGRLARDDRVHIHLLERDAVISREPRRHDLEVADLRAWFPADRAARRNR